MTINKLEPRDEEQRPDYIEEGSLEELALQIPSESFYYPETGEEGEDEDYFKEVNEPKIKQSFIALKYKLKDNDFFKENG